VGYFDHTTVPGRNDLGPVVHDEEIFASDKVTCIGLSRPCKFLQEQCQVSNGHSLSPCIMQACRQQALHSCKIWELLREDIGCRP